MPNMRVYIGTYHGSQKEMDTVIRAGFRFTKEGSMHVQEPINADPYEVAKLLHACGRVKVAIGEFFTPDDGIESVQIFVSDDWFHQR